jgi:hypothetical protein
MRFELRQCILWEREDKDEAEFRLNGFCDDGDVKYKKHTRI